MTRQPNSGAKGAHEACLASKDRIAGAFRYLGSNGSRAGKIFTMKRRLQEVV